MGRLFVGLAFVLLTILTVSCGPPLEQPLTVGFQGHLASQPLSAALESASFPQDSVDLIEFPASIDTLRAFHNGLVDVALVAVSEAIITHQYAPDTRVLQVAAFSRGADAIIVHPEADNLQSLSGEMLVMSRDLGAAYFMRRALDSSGTDLADVNILQETDISHNTVDAFSRSAHLVYEPLLSRMEALGWQVLFSSEQFPNDIIYVLMAREHTLCDRGEQLEQLRRLWFDALGELKWQKESAMKSVASSGDLTYRQMVDAMKRVDFPGVNANTALLAGTDETLYKAIGRIQGNLADYGMMKPGMIPATALLEASECQ